MKTIKKIKKAVLDGDYENIGLLCESALKEGETPQAIITDGLTKGMDEITSFLGKKGMYLDRVLWSTTAFQFGNMVVQNVIEEVKEKIKKPIKGTVVIGVPDGPWTIGPEVVSAVLTAHGYEVHNAGSDVGPHVIAQKAKEVNADIVATGLYLSYRIHMLEELEEDLMGLGIRHNLKTIISGPASNKSTAVRVGADVYCKNVAEIIDVIDELVEVNKKKMTGRERVMTSMELKDPDRVPLVLFAMTFCAKQHGIPFSEYVSKGKSLAEAEVSTARRFGWDAVIASCDTAVFAEPLGGKSVIPRDDVPRITGPAIRWDNAAEDFKKLKSPDKYIGVGRLAEYLSSVKYMKEMVGDELAIVGWTEGAFQGTMLAMGADPRAIFLLRQDKPLIKEILEWYSEYTFQCAKVFVNNGADIIGSGASVSYYLSPEAFEEFVLPVEQKLFKRINNELGAKILIHSCGYIPQCLKFAPLVNPGGAIQFDSHVNLKWAKALIGDKITIMGNLDCNRIMHMGTSAEVEKASKKAIKDGAKNGGFWLSGGCETPRDMPYENMNAMLKACEKYGTYPIDS